MTAKIASASSWISDTVTSAFRTVSPARRTTGRARRGADAPATSCASMTGLAAPPRHGACVGGSGERAKPTEKTRADNMENRNHGGMFRDVSMFGEIAWVKTA